MYVYLRAVIYSILLLITPSLSFADTVSIKLSELTGLDSIELRGSSTQAFIDLPINPIWDVESMTLFLYYKSSPALETQRSEISVLLNNRLVYSNRIGREGLFKVDIKNPNLADFNTIVIRASQHYCMNCCEDEGSPELWTNIDAHKSYILVNFNKRKFPLNIAFLKEIYLSERLFSPVEFDFVVQKGNPEIIRSASILAGFLGAKIKYRDIYIDHSDRIRSKDTFIIGTYSFVSDLIEGVRRDSNIQLIRNPNDSSKFVLVITGDTSRDVYNAVLSFILVQPTYLSEQRVFVSVPENRIPTFKPYESPNLIYPGSKTLFGRILKRDLVIEGYGKRRTLGFFIPPDLLLTPKEKLSIKLYYNHGLLVREGSSINIYINDKFVNSIPVDVLDESDLKIKEIKVPVSVLNRGFNTLTIENGLVPNKKDFCAAANYTTLKVIIYRNSYIHMPDLVHWTEMPYLEYFVSTGYPFTLYPDMKNTAIVIDSWDKEALSSLYTLLAFIGTRTHVPPYRVEVVLPEDVERVSGKDIVFLWSKDEFIKEMVLKHNKSVLNGNFDRYTMTALMVESPYGSGKTMLVLNANKPELLFDFTKLLYEPKFVHKIRGDILLYKGNGEIYSFDTGNKYYVGHMPIHKKILYKIGYDIRYIIPLIIVAVLILAIAIKKLLSYRHRMRVSSEDNSPKDVEGQ